MNQPVLMPAQAPARQGHIIINADDWGRDVAVTDRTLECVLQGSVSSVSAMVFMADSERAAEIALQRGVDAGLHLNLTTPFTSRHCPPRLAEHQCTLTRFLRFGRVSSAFYIPWLAGSFEYVVKAQLAEWERLYGVAPRRIDGHHHMHLCANVLRQRLLPSGTIVRRNFSFDSGEKSALNRFYRQRQDNRLAQFHRTTDFFFALPPIDVPGRLEKIFDLASRSAVEMETHPVNPDEYTFLTGGELRRRAGNVAVATGYSLR